MEWLMSPPPSELQWLGIMIILVLTLVAIIKYTKGE